MLTQTENAIHVHTSHTPPRKMLSPHFMWCHYLIIQPSGHPECVWLLRVYNYQINVFIRFLSTLIYD